MVAHDTTLAGSDGLPVNWIDYGAVFQQAFIML